MIYNLNLNVYWLLLCVPIGFLATALGIRRLIAFFHTIDEYQPIRKAVLGFEVTVDHSKKVKTPTMGGIIIIAVILLNIILFTHVFSHIILGYLLLIFSFGFTGFLDDFIKIYYGLYDGFQGSKKLVIQLIFSAAVSMMIIAYNVDYLNLPVFVPLLNWNLRFGIFNPCFFILIITGSSNAANITDGLDGLLSVQIILICLTFISLITFDLLGVKNLPVELSKDVLIDIMVVLSSTATCFAGFLTFNYHPAKIFMGDVGSLFAGAMLCYTAILLKIEFLYAIMSLLFIWEIFTSALQVSHYRMSGGKRIFKMAPFHHHLEKSGWSEKKIVYVFWGFCLGCCLLSIVVYFNTY
jgi:phospho-N-acetylmuramoyl-pentapeptide-transferase